MSPFETREAFLCPPVCRRFVDSLPISGAAVSAFSGLAPETVVCASDAVSARIDELQFDLGEGPRWEVARTRTPVLLPHVRTAALLRWPVFGNALLDLDVAALFVFPLVLGAMDIGCVELYSVTPGALSAADQATATVLVDDATWQVLREVLTVPPAEDDDGSDPDSGSPLSRREVYQATGMVLAQTGGTATDALLRLRARAFVEGRTVRDVARDVVNRDLDFTPSA